MAKSKGVAVIALVHYELFVRLGPAVLVQDRDEALQRVVVDRGVDWLISLEVPLHERARDGGHFEDALEIGDVVAEGDVVHDRVVVLVESVEPDLGEFEHRVEQLPLLEHDDHVQAREHWVSQAYGGGTCHLSRCTC